MTDTIHTSTALEPIIELVGVKKSFGPVSVLKGVNLKVHPGKVTALVGDNGAGKSTLIKGLAGVQPYDEGEVLIDGQHRDLIAPRDASGLGIEVVYQDLALCDNLDIVQNMFLGREEPDLRDVRRGTDGEGGVRHPALPLRADRQVGAPEGLLALRRAAADGRHRARC